MISKKMEGLVAGSSVIRAMFEEGKRLADIHGVENVFDFSLGNPNVEAPEAIKEEVNNILSNNESRAVHGYMNNSGYEYVRTNIAEHINNKYGTEITYQNIVMTCGAAGGLNIILKTLLNPEDEVIVFAPFFGEYKNYVSNFDGKLVVVEPNLDTFEPNIEEFKNSINKNTKAVIINSPNNPTGVVYSENCIKELAGVLEQKQEEYGNSIYLISDEPYREIVYDDINVPYILKYYKNTFIGYSYSKSLSLPGERIGYIVTHSDMDDFDNIMIALNVANRILGFVNAPSLFQRVIGNCLDLEVDINVYKKNRDLLYNSLIEYGFTCVKPQGAFYLFLKSPIEDDKEFCSIAKKYNILLVPGSAFGCPSYIRIAYCVSYDQIKNSLDSFKKLANEFDL